MQPCEDEKLREEEILLKYIDIPYFKNNPSYIDRWRQYYKKHKDPQILLLMYYKRISTLFHWIYIELSRHFMKMDLPELSSFILTEAIKSNVYDSERLKEEMKSIPNFIEKYNKGDLLSILNHKNIHALGRIWNEYSEILFYETELPKEFVNFEIMQIINYESIYASKISLITNNDKKSNEFKPIECNDASSCNVNIQHDSNVCNREEFNISMAKISALNEVKEKLIIDGYDAPLDLKANSQKVLLEEQISEYDLIKEKEEQNEDNIISNTKREDLSGFTTKEGLKYNKNKDVNGNEEGDSKSVPEFTTYESNEKTNRIEHQDIAHNSKNTNLVGNNMDIDFQNQLNPSLTFSSQNTLGINEQINISDSESICTDNLFSDEFDENEVNKDLRNNVEVQKNTESLCCTVIHQSNSDTQNTDLRCSLDSEIFERNNVTIADSKNVLNVVNQETTVNSENQKITNKNISLENPDNHSIKTLNSGESNKEQDEGYISKMASGDLCNNQYSEENINKLEINEKNTADCKVNCTNITVEKELVANDTAVNTQIRYSTDETYDCRKSLYKRLKISYGTGYETMFNLRFNKISGELSINSEIILDDFIYLVQSYENNGFCLLRLANRQDLTQTISGKSFNLRECSLENAIICKKLLNYTCYEYEDIYYVLYEHTKIFHLKLALPSFSPVILKYYLRQIVEYLLKIIENDLLLKDPLDFYINQDFCIVLNGFEFVDLSQTNLKMIQIDLGKQFGIENVEINDDFLHKLDIILANAESRRQILDHKSKILENL